MDPSKLLTVKEVAKILKCCEQTVYRLIWQDKLAHLRIITGIRVTQEDVTEFINRKKSGGGASRV